MSDHAAVPASSLLSTVLCAAFLAGACGGGSGPGYGDDSPTSPDGSGSVAGTEIQMISGAYDFQFDPQVDTIAAGDTVTWTNQTSTVHTVTANDGAWDSGDVSGGGSYQRVYDQTGEFPYYCEYHGSPGEDMHGTIVVEQ